MKSLKDSEKKFGKYITWFLKFNICVIIITLVVIIFLFVLDRYLTFPTSIDVIKHLIWGVFTYSLSFLLGTVISYEIFQKYSYVIKDSTTIFFIIVISLIPAFFISVYFEGNLEMQDNDIFNNRIGISIIFIIHIILFICRAIYQKITKRRSQ